MSLFCLVVGFACGFVVAVGFGPKGTRESEPRSEPERGSEEPESDRIPDVEYEVGSEEP